MQHIKGIFASFVTGGSAAAVWLEVLDWGGKVTITVIGIYAARYAYNYWRERWMLKRIERIEKQGVLCARCKSGNEPPYKCPVPPGYRPAHCPHKTDL